MQRMESATWRTKYKKHTVRLAKMGKDSKKNEDTIRELQENMKHNNIRIIRIMGEKKEERIEKPFQKIMTEYFPNLGREKATQVQEAQRVLIKINPKRPTQRHITIKMAKFKETLF